MDGVIIKFLAPLKGSLIEFFMLEFGTYTSSKLSADFFEKTPQPDIKDILNNSLNIDFNLDELFYQV